MDKAVLALVCFTAGAGFGFAVGYFVKNETKKNYVDPVPVEKPEDKPTPVEKEEPKKVELADLSTLISEPAKLATKPGEKGINYHKYVQDLKYKRETMAPPDDDPDNPEPEEELSEDEYWETYDERMEREAIERGESIAEYKKEHEGKIELMTADEWDTDFPETDYEKHDIYYFTEDGILSDEDGNQLPEMETIGPKVRQVGWMRSPEDVIYVRNHPQEREYRIFKERCSLEDWF